MIEGVCLCMVYQRPILALPLCRSVPWTLIKCHSVIIQSCILYIDTILGDSVCLSEEAGKVKPLDVAMVLRLEEESHIDSASRDEHFQQLMTAKSDITGDLYCLSIADLYIQNGVVFSMILIINNRVCFVSPCYSIHILMHLVFKCP